MRIMESYVSCKDLRPVTRDVIVFNEAIERERETEFSVYRFYLIVISSSPGGFDDTSTDFKELAKLRLWSLKMLKNSHQTKDLLL